MASISKRFTASGEARYDVRYRAGARAVEETFKRRHDAENRVRQIEAERLRGQVVDPRRGREKLADFAERWLEARTAKGKPLAPMTKQGYRWLLRRNIEPTIGEYALAEITPSVVRDWYSKVTVNAGRDQAAKSYRLLRAILNTAVDDELISRDPCRIRSGGAEHADERSSSSPDSSVSAPASCSASVAATSTWRTLGSRCWSRRSRSSAKAES